MDDTKRQFTLGDKVYRFRKPVLALLQKHYNLETYVVQAKDSFLTVMRDSAEHAKFSAQWQEFCADAIENADEGLHFDKISYVEVLTILGLFFGLASTVNSVQSTLLASEPVVSTTSSGSMR